MEYSLRFSHKYAKRVFFPCEIVSLALLRRRQDILFLSFPFCPSTVCIFNVSLKHHEAHLADVFFFLPGEKHSHWKVS